MDNGLSCPVCRLSVVVPTVSGRTTSLRVPINCECEFIQDIKQIFYLIHWEKVSPAEELACWKGCDWMTQFLLQSLTWKLIPVGWSINGICCNLSMNPQSLQSLLESLNSIVIQSDKTLAQWFISLLPITWSMCIYCGSIWNYANLFSPHCSRLRLSEMSVSQPTSQPGWMDGGAACTGSSLHLIGARKLSNSGISQPRIYYPYCLGFAKTFNSKLNAKSSAADSW